MGKTVGSENWSVDLNVALPPEPAVTDLVDFSEPRSDAEFPREEISDLLEKCRPFLAVDLKASNDRLSSTMKFYETCRNAYQSGDESIKSALR